MAEDWLTTGQAAELSGYHRKHILRLVRAGNVKARKFGPVWQVSRADLLAYIRKAEKLGAKRGPKRGD
jgi:excisionase family DNA binding protein